MVSEAIEQRGRELLVARKDVDPFSEGKICGDYGAASLVAIRDQVEEQLAAGAIEGDETELVDDPQLHRV
jgi:hypothetical protein